MSSDDDRLLSKLLEDARFTRAGLLGAGVSAGVLGGLQPEAVAASGRTREYWIGAVPTTWNAVPNGRNAIEGEHYSPEQTTTRTVLYRAFSPRWRKRLPIRNAQNHGFLGPLIRADVGDRILVHFKNMDEELGRAHSMHFHG
ncbi:MAG: hypothetical protein ACRDZO_28055, partial [Egibacteraceae bacterium]